MNSRRIFKRDSKPETIYLGPAHLPVPNPFIPNRGEFDAQIPEWGDRAAVPFKTFIAEHTNDNLILESFYEAHLRDRGYEDGFVLRLTPLEAGITHFKFETFAGPTTSFNGLGIALLQFMHAGHKFLTTFVIVDHLLEFRQFESRYPIILGSRFITELQVDTIQSPGCCKPDLPPAIDFPIDCLDIHTHGCCLYEEKTNASGVKETRARGGFGMHFPALPKGWDFCSELRDDEPQNNQRAELAAIVVGVWHVRVRCIKSKSIRICTDSSYVVAGFTEHMPRWRANGYRNAKKKEVVNADFWIEVDNAIRFLRRPLTFHYIKREDNQVADHLAREGARLGLLRA